MKHRIIVAGICVCAWLCGSVQGQETSVTNLLIRETLRQGTNSIAAGVQSTALGKSAMADGDYSLAEGDTTMATGTASHAEGTLTIAGGDSSHAEGLATEAMAANSHAGGAYARVRAQDSNAFIHATGTATNDMKETQFPNAAHFDRLLTLESALDQTNAVLSRLENDQRYLAVDAGESVSTNVWENWNADMLDGYHADYFASTQQLVQKLSVTGGLASGTYNLLYGSEVEGARAQYYVNDGSILLVGGEEPASLDSMHIKLAWDVNEDDPSDPSIDLKPIDGASLRGLKGSERWWTDGRFCATNSGKTSEFFAVQSGSFVGDGSGLTNLPLTSGHASSYQVTAGYSPEDASTQIKMWDGNILLVGGEQGLEEDMMHIKMWWDAGTDDPSDPCIDIKPNEGATLSGLAFSDRWWTDGRFSATNSGKTSEFFAVQAGTGRFTVGLFVPQQGDISMGSYTNGTF